MKRFFLTLIVLVQVVVWSCQTDKKKEITFISPEIGSTMRVGEPVNIKLDFGDEKLDSVTYYVDSTLIARTTDTSSVSVNTSALALGNRLFTAKIYRAGNVQELTSNIILLAATAPQQFGYQVINTFPHDTSSYTQGLEFHDGIFYESDGQLGESSLRKVEVSTGKVIQKVDNSPDIFAEGLTVIGDKIVQLTWQNRFGMIWDKNTFKQIGQFPYQSSQEGWGLTFDGQRLYKSDGSNSIYILNKDTFQEEGSFEVYNHEGPVDQLNELEFIDGKIYANIYQTDKIVIIDPKTGAVTGEIDLSGIYPLEDSDLVLNGIAYDKKGNRLFVTGKKWNKLFQINVVEPAN